MNHILNLFFCDDNCLPDLKLNKNNKSERENQVQMIIREKPQKFNNKRTNFQSQSQTNYTNKKFVRGIQLKSPIKEQFHYQNKQKTDGNKFNSHHLSLLKHSRQNIIKSRIKPLKKLNSQASYYESNFQLNNKQTPSRSVDIKTYTPKYIPQKIDQLEEISKVQNNNNLKTKRPKKICQFDTAIKLKHNLQKEFKMSQQQSSKIGESFSQNQNLPKTPKILKLRSPHLRISQASQLVDYSYDQIQHDKKQSLTFDQKINLKKICLQTQVMQSQLKNLLDQQKILQRQSKFMAQILYQKLQSIQKFSFQLKQLSLSRQIQIKELKQFIQITKQRKRVQQILSEINKSGIQIQEYYLKEQFQLETEVGGKNDSRLSFDQYAIQQIQ